MCLQAGGGGYADDDMTEEDILAAGMSMQVCVCVSLYVHKWIEGMFDH